MSTAAQAGRAAPLELLYLTRCADGLWGLLAGAAAGAAPAEGSATAAGGVGACDTGVGEYEPPAELALLVRDAAAALSRAALPAGWKRINTGWPPYSLPSREEQGGGDAGVGPDGSSAGGDGPSTNTTGPGVFCTPGLDTDDAQAAAAVGQPGAGEASNWRNSVAARRIYGPKPPPSL